VLAAKRAGVTTIILPAENKMNVEEDLTPEQLANVTIHYVKTIGEALRVSLPEVAESFAAKTILPPPKETKPEHAPVQPVQSPVVAQDKVVSWHS
ncbi:MAG: S16 family serine protease, partial [Candidatus Sulfotelmatobacter sp.]